MIFVDQSVGSASLLPLLEKAGLPCGLANLKDADGADLEFMGRGEGGQGVLVGIELKRLTELTSDWDRFAGEQIPKMLHSYDHRFLVVEGQWIQNRRGALLRRTSRRAFQVLHGQCDAAQLRKKLITLEMCAGIHVCLINHQGRGGSWSVETLRFVTTLYHWWTDDNMDAHKSHIVTYEPRGILPLNKYERAFAAWPGISTKRARVIARVFGNSISAAVENPIADWAGLEVPDEKGKPHRLGTKFADTITRFLRGQ